MPLPSTFYKAPRSQIAPTGIEVSVTPYAFDYDIELHRALDTAGTGDAIVAQFQAPIPATGRLYRDQLPLDGVYRFYRYRHVRAGMTAGAYGPWSRGAKPTILPDYSRPIGGGATSLLSHKDSGWNKQQGSIIPIPSASGFLAFHTSTANGVQMYATQPSDLNINYPDGSVGVLKSTGDAPTYPTAPAPTLSSVAGGAKAATTIEVKIGYVKILGVGTGLGRTPIYGTSASSALALAINTLCKVTSPAAVPGYVGYVVLANRGGSAGSEWLQLANNGLDSATPFGTDWTEPTTALLVTSQFNASWTGAIVFAVLQASKPYYFYPYLDLVDNRLTFATAGDFPNEGLAPSIARSVIQNQDGHIPLSAGAHSQATPAVGDNPTVGPGVTNSGNQCRDGATPVTYHYLVKDVLKGDNLATWPLPPGTHYGLAPCDDGLWTLVIVQGWASRNDQHAWEDASGALNHPQWTWHQPVPVSAVLAAPNWPGHFTSYGVQAGDTVGQAMRKISRAWPWFDA